MVKNNNNLSDRAEVIPISLFIEIANLIESDKNSILNRYDIINHHQATELVLSLWKEETKNQNIKLL